MTHYRWAIIGAGPAGIAAVGKLLDHGISGEAIVWIDPQFQVGDFGSLWQHVPSNTKVEKFLLFLNMCDAFNFANCTKDFPLRHALPDNTCPLHYMAAPLQWVTHTLRAKVKTIEDIAEKVSKQNETWHIQLKKNRISADNVVLAMGAEPKTLSLSTQPVIPLSIALSRQQIKHHVNATDTIAVFGSSHSAILALRHVLENNVKQVINFYRSPLCYAIYYDDWILHDDMGLKGETATWARQYIDGTMPEKLLRLHSNNENIQKYLPTCDKVIHAVGFSRRQLPVIEGFTELSYDAVGQIAPGLYGLGIAFPEPKYNRVGILEYRVGLWKFMDYLQRVMPNWLNLHEADGAST